MTCGRQILLTKSAGVFHYVTGRIDKGEPVEVVPLELAEGY